MEFIEGNDEVRITGISDFDLSKTFECGQCFRWSADSEKAAPSYTGIAYGYAATLRRDGDDICISGTLDDVNTVWRNYFDLDRDYIQIRRELCSQSSFSSCVSDFMLRATDFGKGIRILRQEPWEALCTFILSQNNHIPRIKKIVAALCREFGTAVPFKSKVLYTFPSAKDLAPLCEADLASLRCGYRAEYILTAARAVANNSLNFDVLSSLHACQARTELMKLRGVGNKVADCVLLYGLHMLDTFPVDVWIKRAISRHFSPDFDPSCFSPYAGVAQQYIFYYIRTMLHEK